MAGAAAAAMAAGSVAGASNLPELDLSAVAASAPSMAADTPAPPAAEAADLDFDLDLTTALDAAQAPAPAAAPTPADEGLDFDWDLPPADGTARADDPAAAAADAPSLPPELAELSLDLPGDDSPATAEGAPAPAEAGETAEGDVPIDDLSSLEVAEGLAEADPLETKLSLAREFEAIGDIDGARTLAEEVVAEATGELQERARAFLAQLA